MIYLLKLITFSHYLAIPMLPILVIHRDFRPYGHELIIRRDIKVIILIKYNNNNNNNNNNNSYDNNNSCLTNSYIWSIIFFFL